MSVLSVGPLNEKACLRLRSGDAQQNETYRAARAGVG